MCQQAVPLSKIQFLSPFPLFCSVLFCNISALPNSAPLSSGQDRILTAVSASAFSLFSLSIDIAHSFFIISERRLLISFLILKKSYMFKPTTFIFPCTKWTFSSSLLKLSVISASDVCFTTRICSKPVNIDTIKDVNPLSPKSDQHQISPCNINALLNRVVIRITDMITQDVFAWYFINSSPLLL